MIAFNWSSLDGRPSFRGEFMDLRSTEAHLSSPSVLTIISPHYCLVLCVVLPMARLWSRGWTRNTKCRHQARDGRTEGNFDNGTPAGYTVHWLSVRINVRVHQQRLYCLCLVGFAFLKQKRRNTTDKRESRASPREGRNNFGPFLHLAWVSLTRTAANVLYLKPTFVSVL